MMNLNETGAFIWNLLNGENTVDDIVGKMTKEYDVLLGPTSTRPTRH